MAGAILHHSFISLSISRTTNLRRRPATVPAYRPMGTKVVVSSMSHNQSYWASIDSDIDTYLKNSIPVRHPISVFEPMHYLTFSPPKTTAAALCIAACELVGGSREDAMEAASAIHLMHAAAYTHENLPLTDRTTKPKPGIPHIFGPNIELLTGDGIMPFGLELLARSMNPARNNSGKILRVIIEITRAVGSQGVVDGQYRESQASPDPEWVEHICIKKEGGLHACGAACGAILGGGGCGRNCLRNCCLPGAKLPLYAFQRSNKVEACVRKELPFAFLDSLLLGEWEDRMERGLFRYDVTACETKVIPGDYGFVAQLNEGRHLKKRPTEFRVDKVLQPFDENKFNFTKVGQEEVLFQFEASENDEVQFHPYAPIDVEKSPSVVAINVSPIEYGHVLLIPRILERLPQRIDRESFLLALYMASEAGNPYFRLGYNSLGAFATINHLHFQAYYLAVPFPIEKAPTRKISDFNSGVIISEILKYPVRGLVFEGGNSLEDLSNAVSDSCICLQENNVPYNVLISDSGRRIFLLPQCYAEKQALGEVSSELLDTQVNPAVWEISGHMVLKRKEDYEGASEENAWRLLAEVSLSEERFQEVIAIIFEAISCAIIETRSLPEEDEERDVENVDALNNGSHAAIMPGKQECLVQH